MADAPPPAGHDPRRDRVALVVVGILLVGTVLAAVVREATAEWRRTQAEARRIAAAHAGQPVADALPSGLRQIWIPELQRADRCITCHVGIEAGKDLLEAANPARSHPRPELIKQHPIEKFGCTLCHGGQGAATTKDAAHGEVPFWDEPLLSTKLADTYHLKAAELMEVNCNACHRRQETVEGMPLIMEARTLVGEMGCDGCHRIDGLGGAKGPELTKEGDKSPEHLVFPAGWTGPRTTLAWHAAHFKSPKSMVPSTKMKLFRSLNEHEATALGVLVMSWRTLSLPAAWTPRPTPR